MCFLLVAVTLRLSMLAASIQKRRNRERVKGLFFMLGLARTTTFYFFTVYPVLVVWLKLTSAARHVQRGRVRRERSLHKIGNTALTETKLTLFVAVVVVEEAQSL